MKNINNQSSFESWDNHQSVSKINKKIVIDWSNYWLLNNINDDITIKWDNHARVNNVNWKIKIWWDNNNSVTNVNDKIKIWWTNFGDINNLNDDIIVNENEWTMSNINGDLSIKSLDINVSSEWWWSNQIIIQSSRSSLLWTITQTNVSWSSSKIITFKSRDLTIKINLQSGSITQRGHEVLWEKIGNSNITTYQLYGGYEIIHLNNSRRLLYEWQLLTIEKNGYTLEYKHLK